MPTVACLRTGTHIFEEIGGWWNSQAFITGIGPGSSARKTSSCAGLALPTYISIVTSRTSIQTWVVEIVEVCRTTCCWTILCSPRTCYAGWTARLTLIWHWCGYILTCWTCGSAYSCSYLFVVLGRCVIFAWGAGIQSSICADRTAYVASSALMSPYVTPLSRRTGEKTLRSWEEKVSSNSSWKTASLAIIWAGNTGGTTTLAEQTLEIPYIFVLIWWTIQTARSCPVFKIIITTTIILALRTWGFQCTRARSTCEITLSALEIASILEISNGAADYTAGTWKIVSNSSQSTAGLTIAWICGASTAISWTLKTSFWSTIVLSIWTCTAASCSPKMEDISSCAGQTGGGRWRASLARGSTGCACRSYCILECCCWAYLKAQIIVEIMSHPRYLLACSANSSRSAS